MSEMSETLMAQERPVKPVWLAMIVAVFTLLFIGFLWLRPPGAADQNALFAPPPSPPPAVEPLALKPVAPETAREINAAIPFVTGKNPAAKPFHLTGDAIGQARAIDCLASAIYYEAAAEKIEGQKAVAQVVLNRARHPAYPSSVCGVVYQGATRRTGCQFSFSCDGSMVRRPSTDLWNRLRKIARSMLNGEVYAPVGLATHYHTDWVVPYWSAKLDKIRAEQTHLFLRWTGWWGTPPAFRQKYAGQEPLVARLGGLSPAHASALAGEVALDAGGVMPDDMMFDQIGTARLDPVFASPAGNFLIFAIDRGSSPAALAEAAATACGTNSYCKVMMWADRAATPASLPITDAQRDRMAFSYLRDPKSGTDKALWNCTLFARPDPSQCIRQTLPAEPNTKPDKSAALPTKPTTFDRDSLIPVNPDIMTESQPGDRLKPGTDSFSGRRRPGGGN